MKKVIFKVGAMFIAASMLLSCSPQKVKKSYNQGVNITPMPNQLVKKTGEFKLKSGTKIVADASLKTVADYFAAKINSSTGFDIKTSANGSGIVLKLDNSIKGNETYKLSVKSSGVEILAKTARGAFYGMQSFMQLLPAEIESKTLVSDVDWTAPCVEIEDTPRFVYRGMHLDVCRHFYPVDFIKKQLDVMAMFKMNTFHWHLTEDQGWRIEIKKYPKLTVEGAQRVEGEGNTYGGFYSQEDVKEIVKYAAERFINVVPEIELPGHALGALTAYPEYSCTGGPFKVRNVWGVEPDVYCAGKESTFKFLEDIIDEVVALFPYEYFHIGGDECPKDRWKVCKACQARIKKEGLKDEHELQSYFVTRIEKYLNSKGRKMIGWDEILEGGLAPSATVMSWRGEKGGIEAAEMGHDVIMTPGNWCYLDHFQGNHKYEPVAIGGYTTLEESYGYDPVPKKLSADKAKHVLGTQGNVWSEYMYTGEIVEHRVYPRIIALAEVNWTQKDKKNFTEFTKRLDNIFVRLDKHNINYHIPKPEGYANQIAFINDVELKFTTTRPVKMVYTTDGTEPTVKSPEHKAALKFTENTTLKIACILNTGKVGPVRTIKIEKQAPLAATNKKTKKGFIHKSVEGVYRKVADIKGVKDWKMETKSDMKVVPNKDNPSAHIMSGYIEVPETGVYYFSTEQDQLFIDNKLIVDNGYEVKRFSRHDGSVALEKGKHQFKLVYLNNIIGGWPSGWNGIRWRVKKSGDKKFKNVKIDMLSY